MNRHKKEMDEIGEMERRLKRDLQMSQTIEKYLPICVLILLIGAVMGTLLGKWWVG